MVSSRMQKIAAFLLKSVLFYTIILFIIFGVLDLALSYYNLVFRQWTLVLFIGVIAFGFIVGVFQLIFKLKNKIAKIASLILFALFASYWLLILGGLGMLYFAIEQEHVIKKEGKKYLIRVYTFKETFVHYYDYKGPFVRSSKHEFVECYGKAKFNFRDLKSNEPNLHKELTNFINNHN